MIVGIDGNEANQNIRVGSGVYAFELLKQFNKFKIQNSKFKVYLKNKPLEDMPSEDKNFEYRIIGPNKLWTQIGLPINLWKEKLSGQVPDVFLSLSHYAPRFCPIPSVITVFDLSFLKFPEMFLQKDLYKLKSWTSYSVKQAERIITISESSKKDIMKYFSIKEEIIKVVYPGYDKNKFKVQSASWQTKFKIEEVKNKYKIIDDYILFVGTIQPRKNLNRLLEAFKILKRKHIQSRDLKLVVAGMIKEGRGGWMQENFFSKIKDLGLEKEVIITGYIPDDDIPLLFSGAKAYVLPSLYEGFGIPVIEAMACGCPVVTSNLSSLPEIAGNAAILINPYDTDSLAEGISNACYNQSIRRDLIRRGLEQVVKFNWRTSSLQILSVLQSLNS